MPESTQPDDEGPAADVRGAVRAEFDWSAVPPSTAVVEAVAIAADREPLALEPLYETIDPDALDALMQTGARGSTGGTTSVTFALDGHEVTVQRDGTVVVQPIGARRNRE